MEVYEGVFIGEVWGSKVLELRGLKAKDYRGMGDSSHSRTTTRAN